MLRQPLIHAACGCANVASFNPDVTRVERQPLCKSVCTVSLPQSAMAFFIPSARQWVLYTSQRALRPCAPLETTTQRSPMWRSNAEQCEHAGPAAGDVAQNPALQIHTSCRGCSLVPVVPVGIHLPREPWSCQSNPLQIEPSAVVWATRSCLGSKFLPF